VLHNLSLCEETRRRQFAKSRGDVAQATLTRQIERLGALHGAPGHEDDLRTSDTSTADPRGELRAIMGLRETLRMSLRPLLLDVVPGRPSWRGTSPALVARHLFTVSLLDEAHKPGRSQSHSCVSWASSPQNAVKTDDVMLCPHAAGAPDGNLDLMDGHRRRRTAVASVPVR
jgi:hypothetical protein